MGLWSGIVIPFQFKSVNKLVQINFVDHFSFADDMKKIIHDTFSVYNFKLYNKKIGFEIPEHLLYFYMDQRLDYTNFVIEIVASDDRISKESETISEPLIEYTLEQFYTEPTDDHVHEILATAEGQVLCYGRDSSKCLNEEHKNLLAKLITSREMDKILAFDAPLTISNDRYIKLANAISNMFPNEDATTYYEVTLENLSLAKGKLRDEFNSLKCRYLENCGKSRYRRKILQDDFRELNGLQLLKQDFLLYLNAWSNTHQLRMTYINNIENPLEYYAQFMSLDLDHSCVELVDCDFEQLHPGKGRKLMDNWDQISERIFTAALLSGRNDVPLILDLYGHIPQLAGFMMFSYFLENYNSNVQPFMKDNLRNLVIHIESDNCDHMRMFRQCYKEYSYQRPRVFVTGKKAEQLRFCVFVGNTIQYMKTILEAVDFCFKLYHALRLPYIEEQNQGWKLIQNAVYDINLGECDTVNQPFFDILRIS